jgi:cytochrome c peroxidase
MPVSSRIAFAPLILALLLRAASSLAALPPVIAPPENTITEEKRILGKILFWEEQLSSNDTVACGTCHRAAQAGADPRQGTHPGPDALFGTEDDVIGSPGIVRLDSSLQPVDDALFGFAPQVTRRTAQSYFGGAHASELFWDGRATSEFIDPLDPMNTAITSGGAFESQSLAPILSVVEMAHEGRSWGDVTAKLEIAVPLALATSLPPDMSIAITANPTYPQLFLAAFGDQTITPVRIAFAIATYERTLVADQTPWDLFVGGDLNAMTVDEQRGWSIFESEAACIFCHPPPLFTDNAFHNIGLRPSVEDLGREEVTGDLADRGRFKTPSLRNTGLNPSLMHVGFVTSVFDATEFYNAGSVVNSHVQFTLDQSMIPTNLGVDLPYSTAGLFGEEPDGTPVQDLVADFISNALTDPRVAAEEFPFDRPTLYSEYVPEPSLQHSIPAGLLVLGALYRTRKRSLAALQTLAVALAFLVFATVFATGANAHDEGDEALAALCVANGGPFGVPGLAGDPAVIGEWNSSADFLSRGVHATLLHTGKVMAHVQASGTDTTLGTILWDPSDPLSLDELPGNANPHPSSTVMGNPPDPGNLFCSGHTPLTDGRTLVMGGGGAGAQNASIRSYIFDGDIDSGGDPDFPWIRRSDMNHHRWYPTATSLPDGRVLVSGGRAPAIPGVPATCCLPLPSAEIYQPVDDTWTDVSDSPTNMGSYPRMYVLPDGLVLKASGSDVQTFDVLTQTWEIVLNTPVSLKDDEGTGAMYRPGKVLIVGGRQIDPDDWATNNLDLARVLDATVEQDQWDWRLVSPMNFKRRRADTVLLPDGTVLVVGGLAATQQAPECAVHAAELWDPDTEVFTQLASQMNPRLYHSTTLLLPDGRVIAMGGEDDHEPTTQFESEIFSPPYLFQGPRPTITSAPRVANYGQSIEVITPDGATIDGVSFMRTGSVTHNNNQSQRFLELSFSQTAGGLNVVLPADGNLAPAGEYMLFLVDSSGVPSIATFIRMLIDRDGDGILDDGDASLFEGDSVCTANNVTDCDDNCPLDSNPSQIDTDADAMGNLCDSDDDNDGYSDDAEIAGGSDPLDPSSIPPRPVPSLYSSGVLLLLIALVTALSTLVARKRTTGEGP